MSEIQQRIKLFIKEVNMSMSEFSKKIGTHQSSLSRALSEGNNVGDAMINKIALAFDISKTWLLTGEGQMFLDFTKLPVEGSLLTDKDFDDVEYDLYIVNKLETANPRIKSVSDSYDDALGNIELLEAFIKHYSLRNKMSDILDYYKEGKVKMSDVKEHYKKEFQRVKELYQIIEPYKEMIKELYTKVSDFNDANDRLYCLDDD